MDRVDSGFDESYGLKAASMERGTVRRSKTTHSRHRKSKTTYSEPSQPISPSSASMDMSRRRPASEKRSSERQKPTERRRRSIASSSENSAKSRNRGQGSKPSSRRTSCTFVDPSRPVRHYRIKSTQSVNTATRDIDDVLALHFRSCNMFQNPTYDTGRSSGRQSLSRHGTAATDIESVSAHDTPDPEPQTTEADDVHAISTRDFHKQSEDTYVSVRKSDTMEWMSPDTRRREYEKIDRANSGVRGLVRRFLPRCVSGPPPPRFYEKDMSDVGSVRRYRVSLDEEDFEKSSSALREHGRKLEKPAVQSKGKSTKWGCF